MRQLQQLGGLRQVRCEKSWAEADSFSFGCRGCAKMNELEVELEQLRLLVMAMMGREKVGCASGSGGGGSR